MKSMNIMKNYIDKDLVSKFKGQNRYILQTNHGKPYYFLYLSQLSVNEVKQSGLQIIARPVLVKRRVPWSAVAGTPQPSLALYMYLVTNVCILL